MKLSAVEHHHDAESYDSAKETLEHIEKVKSNCKLFITKLSGDRAAIENSLIDIWQKISIKLVFWCGTYNELHTAINEVVPGQASVLKKIIFNSVSDWTAEKDAIEFYVWICRELATQAEHHDESKLSAQEKPYFDKYTPKLKGMTYGSDEYKECLKLIGPALDSHYLQNRHHPEHFEDGVLGMNIVDFSEMLMDWRSSAERHADGDIIRSIHLNKERFHIDDETALIMEKTISELKE